LFALLAHPESNADATRLRTLDALGSWVGRTWARRFSRERVDPWFFQMPNQQMYNQIDRSWRRITDRLLAAELAMRVLGRMAQRAAYPCRAVLVDRLPGEESDIERLHLCLGLDRENAAGLLSPATITSVTRDHAKSIARLRERRSKARSADDLDVSIGHEISNIFSRIWTPSKPVLHLAIALCADVEETYPGEAQWGKQLSMLANPSWLANCLHRAEVFRTVHAPRITPLRLVPLEMIQLLPANA
jgi:hypothetical protein